MKTALLALFVSFPAFAAPVVTTCQLPEASANVVVTYAPGNEFNAFGVVTTKLVVDEVEIPMIRSSCLYKDVPGQRGFLCAHQSETKRYDVYPRITKNSHGSYAGAVDKLFLVSWDENGTPTSYSTEDCR